MSDSDPPDVSAQLWADVRASLEASGVVDVDAALEELKRITEEYGRKLQQVDQRRIEEILTEAEQGGYANASRDYGRGVAYLARRLREVLPAGGDVSFVLHPSIPSTNPNTGGTAVPFALDPLVKTNHPADKEFPYFVRIHENQLPQRLVELDDDWIRSTLDELVIVEEDPLYWIARRGRYFEPDPTRAYFLPSYDPESRSNGELPLNRLLPEDDMWSLILWSELTDRRIGGQCVATSILTPWSSDRELRVDVVRQAVQAIMAQLDAKDEMCRITNISPLRGRIRFREA